MQGKSSRFFIGTLERQQEYGLLIKPEPFASKNKKTIRKRMVYYFKLGKSEI
jgi:hypothetical protein